MKDPYSKIRFGFTKVGNGTKFHYLPPDSWRMTACHLVSGIVYEQWTKNRTLKNLSNVCHNCQGWLNEHLNNDDLMASYFDDA